MRRRGILVSVGGGSVLSLSGCLDRIASSTSNGEEVEPKEYPEVPHPLSKETVLDFAEEYAETDLYNSQITENTTDINLVCGSVLDRDVDGGFYVMADCEGSRTVDENGSESVGEISVQLYPLFIDEQTVITIDRDRTEYRSHSQGTDHSNQGFQLLNFGETDQTIDVRIASLETPADDTVFEDTYSLDAKSGIVQDDVVEQSGEYQYTITVDDDLSETYEWENSPRDQPIAVGIYLTPDEDIEIDELPDEFPLL